MIERYANPELADLFTDEARYRYWARVELAVLYAQAALGVVPEPPPHKLLVPDPSSVAEVERRTRHDVAAFVECMGWQLDVATNKGGAVADYFRRWLHFGLTSSDVVDTGTALALRDASVHIHAGTFAVNSAIRALLMDHGQNWTMARTHGQHARPIRMGHRFQVWSEQLARAGGAFAEAAQEMRVGKLTGPTGEHTEVVTPEVERKALEALHLVPVRSTQVIPRDLYAAYVVALSRICNALEQVALDIRLLAQTEVAELLEPKGPEQMGSSSMPHKRNPVTCEKVCGLARLVRGYASTMMDHALWNERDISHSSVERVVLPDAILAAHHALDAMYGVLGGLVVNTERWYDPAGPLAPVDSYQATLDAIRAGESRSDAWWGAARS